MTWIEGVSQSVPEEIEARHGQGDRDPGEDGHPRRRGEIALRVVEHVTPAREGRLDPVTEIADVRLEEDGPGHAEGGRHRDDADGIGEEVAQHDPRSGGAQPSRALHELAFTEGEHLGAHDARHVHPRGDPDDEGHGEKRRRHEGGESQEEEDGGKGQHGVGDPQEHCIEGAPEVAGDRAEEGAESHGDEHGGHSHGEGDAPGVEEPAQHVAAELVGAQHMSLAQGRGELVPHLDLDRIGQAQPTREAGAEPKKGDHDHAAHGGAMAQEAGEDGRLSHDRRTRGSTAA